MICQQNVQISSGFATKNVFRLDAGNLETVDGAVYKQRCDGGGCRENGCPSNSKCVEDWTRHHCECNKGRCNEVYDVIVHLLFTTCNAICSCGP